MNYRDRIYIPSGVKLKVTITAPGFDMDTDDFTVQIIGKNKTLTFQKSDIYKDLDDGHYYVCFNLTEFGSGLVRAITTAHIPDEAFNTVNNGIRDSVMVNDLFIAMIP